MLGVVCTFLPKGLINIVTLSLSKRGLMVVKALRQAQRDKSISLKSKKVVTTSVRLQISASVARPLTGNNSRTKTNSN